MNAKDRIMPVKDMIYFASLYPKDTNIGISIYAEIKDYEIDITDNIALKAFTDSTFHNLLYGVWDVCYPPHYVRTGYADRG